MLTYMHDQHHRVLQLEHPRLNPVQLHTPPIRTTTSQICEADRRRARIEGA